MADFSQATEAEKTAALVAAGTILAGFVLVGAAGYILVTGSLLVALLLGVVGVGVFAGGSLFGYRAF